MANATPPSLQSSLHAATRQQHMQLNKTITTRLPLCLPPHSSDPTAYHLGMLVFGQIFLQFEVALDRLDRKTYSTLVSAQKDDTRHQKILHIQQTQGLSRTQSIKHDAELLRNRLTSKHLSSQDADLIRRVAEQVEAQAVIQTKYIQEHIISKPYLVLAYTWTMYLALFNGGRWLHRQLASAGPPFWLEDQELEDDQAGKISVLSFWCLDAGSDSDKEAEELKLRFKRNFDNASALLSTSEKDEVVREAQSIFDLCLQLVELLDHVMLEISAENIKQHAQQTDTSASSTLATRLWQGISSLVRTPAYGFASWTLASPVKEEVVKAPA